MRTDLKSPIRLPERQAGHYRIKHVYRDRFDVVNMREAILTGRLPVSIKTRKPVRIHQLLHDKEGLWIQDIPAEIRQHREAIARMQPFGRVLVGGLGLGIAATMLAGMKEVAAIDVVEISPEVAALCDPHHPKVNVIVADIRKFFASMKQWHWQSAFIDTWTQSSEGTWWEEVFPLRRLIGQRFGARHGDTVFYWAEDIMLGQVGDHLLRPTRPHWYYKKGLDLPMTQAQARWFIKKAGTVAWERRYGALYPARRDGGSGVQRARRTSVRAD